jgi:hypothetical protein
VVKSQSPLSRMQDGRGRGILLQYNLMIVSTKRIIGVYLKLKWKNYGCPGHCDIYNDVVRLRFFWKKHCF